MKLAELKEHLRSKTIEDLEIPVERAIVSEEFRTNGRDVDYRETSISRLIGMRVPFNSEFSIFYNLVSRYLKASCPYCGGPTKVGHLGGVGNILNINFECINMACGASLTLHIDTDSLSFKPPKGRDKV
jgi:hypothetical protein